MTFAEWCRIAGSFLILASPLSGCMVTTNAMKIGNRIERVHNYERAVGAQDQLLIDYRTILLKAASFQVITRYARRWSAIDLRTADWQSLKLYKAPGIIPGRVETAKIELGPRPETATPPYYEIPILPEPYPKLDDKGTFDYRQELQDAAGSNPLSLCCLGPAGDPLDVLGRQSLVVLSQIGGPGGEMRFTVIQIPELKYRTWWAIPTRVAILPLTIAADAVTLPAQLVILIGMSRMH
jgi:hypothetical protein